MPTVIKLPEGWRRRNLSPAEQRVVELVGSGLPTKVVAAQLGRSPLTVRNQLGRAMGKLSIRNRYELISYLHGKSAALPVMDGESGDTFAYGI
jgi:DNA-binding CsgD family transcriptional regulator